MPAAPALDPTTDETRRLVQRWIGSPQTGDLNDPDTVAELLDDVVGLREYLKTRPPGGIYPAPAPSPAPAAIPVILPAPPLARGFAEVRHSTPNMGGAMRSQGLIFHYTGGAVVGSLSWVKQAVSKVSYHTIIFEDGTRHNVVPLDRVAWHAGVSSFRGRSGCNAFMTGVAFGGDLYQRSLTSAEVASAVEFVEIHKDRYGWTREWITDHRTVAPTRRRDIPPPTLQSLYNALKSVL